MPVRRAPLLAGALLVGSLCGCVIGVDRPVPNEVEQGFEHRLAYTAATDVQPSDGPLVEGRPRYESRIVNVGAPARRAVFRVDLRDDDGRLVWTGTAAVEDVDTGEEVVVVYAGDEPFPDGSHLVEWSVDSAER